MAARRDPSGGSSPQATRSKQPGASPAGSRGSAPAPASPSGGASPSPSAARAAAATASAGAPPPPPDPQPPSGGGAQRRASSSSSGGVAAPASGNGGAASWDAVPDSAAYLLPVDSEHKATRLVLLSFARPHMRAFHLSWLSFFSCFFSTFAAAAVLPVVREELSLTQTDVGYAAIASVIGAVGSRVAMGFAVDAFGPRLSSATLLLLTAPAVFGMALIQTPAAFIALRAVIGLNLSMFVVNQYWVSAMFNTRILGCANALSAGWGNMGGGVAMLVMTALVEGIARITPLYRAWRWALLLPGGLQLLAGAAVLFASDDCPLGRRPPRRPPHDADAAGCSGRAALALPGAAAGPRAGSRGASRRNSRGAPAATDPPNGLGLYDSAGSYAGPAPPPAAGVAAANGKPAGDAGCVPAALPGGRAGGAAAAARRCWSRWVPAAALNYRTYLMAVAYAMSFGVELTVHNVLTTYFFDQFDLGLTAAGLISSIYGLMNLFTRAAGGWASDAAAARAGMRGRLWVLFAVQLLGGVTCVLVGVAHSTLVGSILAVVVFSVFTQAACGAVFGVVPFLSHRSPGFAMGVVASGGNVGSAVMQAVFFTFFDLATHRGFFWMGITVVVLSATLLLVHFPQWGGMLCRPRQGCSEESYYLAEWSQAERAEGLHLPALAFAYEAKSERGGRGGGGASGGGGGGALLPVSSPDAAAALSGRVTSDGGAAALCLCCAARPHGAWAARRGAAAGSSGGGGDGRGSGAERGGRQAVSGEEAQAAPVTPRRAFLELSRTSGLGSRGGGTSNGATRPPMGPMA